jgi:CRP-like cAMP-binding protein
MTNKLPNKTHIDIAFQTVSKYVSIEREDFEQMLPLTEVRTFHKKETIVEVGQQEEYINMVLCGLIRKYTVVRKKEITTQLAKEGHVINSELSFYRRQPSNCIIETIETTTVLSLSFNNLQTLYEQFPTTENLARLFLADMFIRKDNLYLYHLEKTARERFLNFIKNQPDLLQRVPQKYLASYLNIKPETFSRLKHLVKTSQ